MQSDILIKDAKFPIGQQVKHYLLEYRGMVMDADPRFRFTSEELDKRFKDEELKAEPWYQVLVHNTDQLTYVPESHLRAETTEEEFEHPVLEMFFTRDEAGHYQRRLNLQ